MKKSIEELRSLDILAWWADKGPGSVIWGYQKLMQLKVHIHKDSKDLQLEHKSAKWAKDKNGNYKRNSLGQRVPVDKLNHGLDGVRYTLAFYAQ